MKIIDIVALKGGVGKTTTAVNMAYVLGVNYKNKVLLVDNDKQGNLSKAFLRYDDDDDNTVSRLLSEKNIDIHTVIKNTDYENIDIITANTGMIKACLELTTNRLAPQQLYFKEVFEQINEEYDYLVIDNAPDVDIAVINSLACADEIVIPIMIDQYALTGLKILIEQIAIVKKYFNPSVKVKGLITSYRKDKCVDDQIAKLEESELEIFETKIKRTEGKVIESTFLGIPVVAISNRCGASKSYRCFVEEFLKEE